MRPLSRTLCLLVTGLLAASLASAGTMYKWVDADGTVHFGENPPPGVDAKALSVNLEPDPVSDPYPDKVAADSRAAAQEQREARSRSRAEARQEQELVEAQCTAQQRVLDQLEPRPNVLIQSPDGSTIRMDDEERLRLIDEAKAFIRENCN